MPAISVNGLTFSYPGSYDNIFEHVSLELDTDWRLGLIGRNGRGKTTFLRLLMGQLPYSGEIISPCAFSYFPTEPVSPGASGLAAIRSLIAPFDEWERAMEALSADGSPEAMARLGDVMDEYAAKDGYAIDALIEREMRLLDVRPDALARPFETLSNGEKTKMMIAALFLKKNNFLLIDEPTNHLDALGREKMEAYLASKQGFILVSHDRHLLDGVIDHVMSINRMDIEVVSGNFTTWNQNKTQRDNWEQNENARLKKDIKRLKEAFRRSKDWSDKVEETKKGSGPTDRGRIGHLAAKAMQRAKNIESRQAKEIDDKSKLLRNIEEAEGLKLSPAPYHKRRLITVGGLTVDYGGGPLFAPVSFTLTPGDRLALRGGNGSGKTSLLKLLLGEAVPYKGLAEIGGGLIISHVPQDTSPLAGGLTDFAEACGLDRSLFLAVLRKLDFQRIMFEKDMVSYSQGQKKKVYLAKSLCEKAHLYVWDEPLNHIDILSRLQLEELILSFAPTMVFVEHDRAFTEGVATASVDLIPLGI